MIIIRFPDDKAKRRALGFLPGRFSFKSWATGEMMVPENALPFLAVEGIPFSVEGRSEEHTSELQSRGHLVCRLLLEKKKKTTKRTKIIDTIRSQTNSS